MLHKDRCVKKWKSHGMCDGEKISKWYNPNENVYYFKKTWKKNAKTHVAWFKWAAANNIGPLVWDHPGGLVMYAGIKLSIAVRTGLIPHAEVCRQLDVIKETLLAFQVAHCDVKYENCMFFPWHGVRLIDNGDMSRWGHKRKVVTPGMNASAPVFGHIKNIAGPGTDTNGFTQVKKKLASELKR